jgi:TolA-binding protein
MKTMLESAKRLELWFVESSHLQKFPSNQTELDQLRQEVASLRASSKQKSQTLETIKQQVPEWTRQLESLQMRQLSAMFDLVPLPDSQKNSTDQQNVNTMTTDEMWWGQQATDESEDL